MVRAVRPLTLIVAFILLTAAVPAQQRHDFGIPVGEHDTLDAVCFMPTIPPIPPPHGYPAILMVHGFGDSKEARVASCWIYARMGYATFAYSVRGQGKSTGWSTIMAGRERDDLHEVMEFVRNYRDVDESHIAIMGGSQGGLHALWAIADDLAVKAASADAITPHWASDLLMNGCIRRTLVLLLNYPSVRYGPERDEFWNLVRRDAYDTLLQLFPRGRDLDTSLLSGKKTPLLEFLKWQDHYFSAEPGIASFNDYGGPKLLYIGTQGHFSDEVASEWDFQNGRITRWFNEYLRILPMMTQAEPSVTCAFSALPTDSLGQFRWERTGFAKYPPPSVRPTRLYLEPGGSLTTTAQSGDTDSVAVANRYTNRSYTFDMGYIEGFRGKRFGTIIPQERIVFTSPPLDSSFMWIGTPQMKLNISSSDSVFPLHAQIYEVDPAGNEYFINRINFTARHWREGSAGEVRADGIAHAHKFTAGNRVRVVLTNIDCTNRKILGEYPFVLPLFRNASVTIHLNGKNPSYVELPTLSLPKFKSR